MISILLSTFLWASELKTLSVKEIQIADHSETPFEVHAWIKTEKKVCLKKLLPEVFFDSKKNQIKLKVMAYLEKKCESPQVVFQPINLELFEQGDYEILGSSQNPFQKFSVQKAGREHRFFKPAKVDAYQVSFEKNRFKIEISGQASSPAAVPSLFITRKTDTTVTIDALTSQLKSRSLAVLTDYRKTLWVDAEKNQRILQIRGTKTFSTLLKQPNRE